MPENFPELKEIEKRNELYPWAQFFSQLVLAQGSTLIQVSIFLCLKALFE